MCSHGVFLPLWNTGFRPVGMFKTAVTLVDFSTIHILQRWLRRFLPVAVFPQHQHHHHCLHRSDKHSIRRIGLQELTYQVVCWVSTLPVSIKTVFRVLCNKRS